MSQSSQPAFEIRTPLIVCAVLTGLVLLALLPSGVVVMNDDFGYIRSVIETIQRERPWTDDWLEPWAASLSVGAALLYHLTGSFTTAIFGLQLLGIVAGSLAVCRLFLDRGLSSTTCVVVTLLGLTFPTLLWKTAEFTALVIYLPCLCWAIWAAEKRRWWVFGLVWLIALASRQSALAWIAIPVCAAVLSTGKSRGLDGRALRPAVVSLIGIVFFVGLSLGMNQSHAQKLITAQLWSHIHWPGMFQGLVVGMALVGICSGWGALAQVWRNGETTVAFNQAWKWLLPCLLVGTATTLILFKPEIKVEHVGFKGAIGTWYGNSLVLVGAASWALFRIRLRAKLAAGAIAALVLVSVRTDWWDYYFLDAGILAFFSARLDAENKRLPDLKPIGVALAITCAVAHLNAFNQLKWQIDLAYGTCVLNETALRESRLSVSELGTAPFGYIGWKLYPHFVANEGRADPGISGFLSYLHWSPTEIRWSPRQFWPGSLTLHKLDWGASSQLSTAVFRRDIWWYQRGVLLRLDSAGHSPKTNLDLTTYQPQPFPLSDDEWDELIRAKARQPD